MPDPESPLCLPKIDEWMGSSGKLQHEAWTGQTRFYLKEQQGSVFKAISAEDMEAELMGSGDISEIPLPACPKSSSGIISEDFSDFWEAKGRFWIRHHVRPRSTLYVPQAHSAGGPDLGLLSSIRETRFSVVNAPPGLQVELQKPRYDDWRKVTHFERI